MPQIDLEVPGCRVDDWRHSLGRDDAAAAATKSAGAAAAVTAKISAGASTGTA